MADPITWGLINLVKKGVKGVQTTLDGVSDKVSGLPDSLDADFTQVKQAIADVKTDVGGVNTAVSSVKEDTTSIKDTVDTSLLLSADSVVKSVQRGITHCDIYKSETLIATISKVNVNKSLLIASNDVSGYDGCSFTLKQNGVYGSYPGRARPDSPQDQYISWQVIEFY